MKCDVARPPLALTEGAKLSIQSKAFTRTPAWARLRYDFLRDQEGRCHCCGRGPADGARINVDHVLPRKTHPQYAMCYANLQVLCSTCNQGKGNRDRTDWRFQRPAVLSSTPCCPACNVQMIVKTGQWGAFWSCPRFPACRERKSYDPATDSRRRRGQRARR